MIDEVLDSFPPDLEFLDAIKILPDGEGGGDVDSLMPGGAMMIGEVGGVMESLPSLSAGIVQYST